MWSSPLKSSLPFRTRAATPTSLDCTWQHVQSHSQHKFENTHFHKEPKSRRVKQLQTVTLPDAWLAKQSLAWDSKCGYVSSFWSARHYIEQHLGPQSCPSGIRNAHLQVTKWLWEQNRFSLWLGSQNNDEGRIGLIATVVLTGRLNWDSHNTGAGAYGFSEGVYTLYIYTHTQYKHKTYKQSVDTNGPKSPAVPGLIAIMACLQVTLGSRGGCVSVNLTVR